MTTTRRSDELRTARAIVATMVDVNDDIELNRVLQGIVDAACALAGARFGALGVIGANGDLDRFITHGLSDEERARIGPLPSGRGVLGLLLVDPRPHRLHDLTAHPDSVGVPAHHPELHTFLGVPIVIRGELFGSLYLAEREDGADFSAADEELVSLLASSAAVAVDNARLYQAGLHRQRWLEASVEIEEQLLAGTPQATALARVCDRVQELAQADLVAILLPEGDQGGPHDLVVHAASGVAASAMAGARVPVDRSVSGAVLRTGAPEGVSDFASDPRVAWIRGAPPLGPARVVPMVARGRAIGILLVGRGPGSQPLSREDGALVDAFARQAAIALELAELQEQRRSLAVYRDRERIARDLHDLVIQRIFGSGLTVQSLRARIPDELRPVADAVVDDLDAAITDLRSAIFSLQRPGHVRGLRGEIVDTSRAATATLGFEPRVRMEGPLDSLVPDAVAQQLVSVVAEALTNVARHAQASAATVAVRAAGGWLQLEVTDDGIGPPTASSVPGNGLRNMRIRAVELGGRMQIDEAPGGGARLSWAVPLSTAEAAGRV